MLAPSAKPPQLYGVLRSPRPLGCLPENSHGHLLRHQQDVSNDAPEVLPLSGIPSWDFAPGPYVVPYLLSCPSTLSAARTPRYCASSKMEKPLRRELANRIRPRDVAGFGRSAEKIAPTFGRAIACPIRMMLIRDTHLRMSPNCVGPPD